MRIIVLQTLGGVSKNGVTGGGGQSLAALMTEWAMIEGVEVLLLTNASDFASPAYYGTSSVLRAPSAGKVETEFASHSFFLEMVLNPIIQRSFLKKVASQLESQDSRTIVLASTPFPSDILAALVLHRRQGFSGVVYFHHVCPSPLWFPLRRGSLFRVTWNWLAFEFAMLLTKIGGLAISLDNPSTVSLTGWRVNGRVVPNENFLGQETVSARTDALISAKDHRLCCFVGRLSASKGAFDLLKVWKIVTSGDPDLRLTIAGPTESRATAMRLQTLSKRWKLNESVRFLGYVSEGEKRELLRKSTLFLQPSYEEGWSRATMEAISFGAVPVLYDLPAYEYLGPDRVRVSVGDTSEMAKRVLELSRDSGSRLRIAQSMMRQIEKYTREGVANRTLIALSRLSSNSDNTPDPASLES